MIKMKPRVAIVLTSHATLGSTGRPTGSWLSEIAIPYLVWSDVGCAITLASIKGGAAVIDPSSGEDEWQTDETRQLEGNAVFQAAMANTVPCAALRGEDIDILYMPGGAGTMWDLPENPVLKSLIASILARPSGVVATLCHGAAALVGVRSADGEPLVAGRRVTCVTDEEEDQVGGTGVVPFLLETRLRELGADFAGGVPWSDTAVRDGRLVTGQNPQSAKTAALLCMEALTPSHETI